MWAALGWWIIGHWWMPGTQSYPKPSISVRPSNVVTLGGNVIICCQSEGYQHMQFYLQKAASSYVDTVSIKVAEWDEVVFPIFNVTQSDAGIYWCTYCFKASCEQQWSDSSDRAYINISDPSLPKPTIKMRPKGESAPGMNVTIECQGPEHVLIFSLHKSKDLIASQVVAAANVTATFPFPAVRLEDVGSYTCQYRLRGSPFIWSRPSDPVELILRDPSLSKPSIKVRPGEQLGLGMNVTIECQGQDEHLNFSLYKSKKWIASLLTEPSKNTVEFHFFGLRLEDQGSYTCQYHHKDNLFVWSEPSDPVQIIVREAHTTEDFVTIIWASLAVGLLLVLLLLLLAFILYRKRKKGSTANERTQPLPLKETSMFLEAEAGEDPDGVSYAVLNHHPLKSKQPANPDIVPESCVYASVINSRTSEG